MPRMSLSEQIRRFRTRAGLTMAQAAKRAGWRQASSYQRYEDAEIFTRQYLPMDVAQRLIRAFAGLGNPPVTAKEVLALTQPIGQPLVTAPSRVRMVEVIAVVEAGVWREAWELPPEERQSFPMPSLPGYEGKTIFGLEVRGNSMNEVYPEGAIAFFVKPEDLPPVEGHIVVVSAQRQGLHETTLKEYRRDRSGRIALWPRSTDPRHQKPIYPDEIGADAVEIIGVAIGKFELLPSPARNR